MKFPNNYLKNKKLVFLCCLFTLTVIPGLAAREAHAQGTNYTGNGGRHIIQGRIYLPSGRTSGLTNVKVRLESLSMSELSVFADVNGSFSFKNLVGGSYFLVIQIEGFEEAREPAFLDDPGSSSLGGRASTTLASTQKTITVPVYLRQKKDPSNSVPSSVISAELASVPKPAADAFNRALSLSNEGNYEKAIVELKTAVSLFPKFPLALNELGRLYAKTGDRDKSIESFRGAADAAPEAFNPRYNLGCALVELKKYEEAATQLNVALKINGYSAQAFICMGRAQMGLQNLQFAQKAFVRAIEIGGGNLGKAHYYLGGIYWGEKQYQKAADELEKYLKLEPNATDAEQTRKAISELRSKQN